VVEAVKRIDFEVPKGAFFTLLGPSGCGKTTTLRCLAGLEQPDGGRIVIDGVTVAEPAKGTHVPAFQRDIGMVFQSYAIWPHMDVFANVAYPLRVRKPRVPKADVHGRVMEALRLVGMESMADRPATRLSGGQQQRVAFARALVRQPKLLLLDEPLSNLDAKLREQMRFELQELVERVAITTIYVTHDQSEALAMSDTVAVMSDGIIVQQDSPRTVYREPANAFVAAFLGAANVMSGRVVERGRVAVEGAVLSVATPASLNGAEAVSVIFRPEDVMFLRAANGEDNLLEGAVDRLSFQGGVVECHLRVGTSVVRATLRAAEVEGIERGTRAWIRVRPERCLVFAN
jgi:iron(III) transport system ATP-binding protein